MSIVKELKSAETKIEALQAEKDAAIAQVEQLKTERDASIAEIQAKLTAADGVIAGLTATVAERDLAIVEKDKAIEALNGEKVAIEAECQKVKQILERPEFADALAVGQKAIDDGGEAGSQQVKTQDQWLQEYAKIEDPAERTAFRNAHRKELGL
jgi:chromosome segregation ATPase